MLVSMRLMHWAEEEACVRLCHVSLPLPMQPWAAAWGSSSTNVKIVNAYIGCRGNLVCSSVNDIARMATSLQSRLLFKLGTMKA